MSKKDNLSKESLKMQKKEMWMVSPGNLNREIITIFKCLSTAG